MANTKEIQRRIKSVNNTKKITRAMEMVAAAKMRKAIEAVLKTRTYANLSWTTVLNLAKAENCGKEAHVLLSMRENIRRVAIVLMASNRGLCGGFNSAVINKAHDSVLKHPTNSAGEKIETDFIVMGRRGMSVASRYGHNVVAQFPKLDISYEVKEVIPVAKYVMDDFISGKYDKVMVAFTDFVSPSKQIPRVKQLLPVDVTAEKDHHLGVVGSDTRVGLDADFIKQKEDKYLRDKNSYVFEFEPSAAQVLSEMVPRLIEVQLFQALLESNASEHSARMAAMHQATDAAKDLAKQLNLFYNKARQAAITSEIAEISAGADALSG
jgi:F-type H+-transporting ATPase subunit gamma